MSVASRLNPTQWALPLLRRLAPIIVVGRRWPGLVLVLRHADVLEVLRREDDFSVALSGLKMKATIGSFFLGMPEGPQYRRERAAMDRAVPLEDLPDVQRLAASLASRCVEQAIEKRGQVDLVAEVAHVVVPQFVNRYFGIAEPERGSLLEWFQLASYYVFGIDLFVGPRFYVPAARASEQIAAHMRAQVEKRQGELRSGASLPDDVLTRLVRMQAEGAEGIDADAVRRMLTGTLSGTLIPTSWLAVSVLHTLLQLPEETLAPAREAARAGDDAAVRRYVIEAARFTPFPPVIYRYCERDTVLAAGTRRARTIPAGTTVLCLIGSAALDPDAIPAPRSFLPSRPESQYLLFGHGHHFCLGKGIAEALLTEMTKAVLCLDVDGPIGPIERGVKGRVPDGYYPAHLIVRARVRR